MDRLCLFACAGLVSGVLLPAAQAVAQTGPDLLLKPFRLEDQFELNLDTIFGLETETSNADPDTGEAYDFRINQYRAEGRLRLTPGESEEGIARAQPRAGFAYNQIQIQSSDPRVPDSMLDASVAVGMGVLAVDGWLGGVTLGYGYAAADGNDDANASYVQANFAVGKTFSNGVDSFGVVINYDGNRSILPDWPLPGFQYRKRLDDEFILSLGFPYSGLEWRPNERFTLTVQYSIPDTFTARADYDLVAGVGLYGSFERSTLATHWDELEAGHHRVFFRQSLVEGGLAWDIDKDKLRAIGAVGYAFEQEFDTGFDTRDLEDLAEVDDNVYLRAALELRL